MLGDLKVIELASVLAGPSVGQFLAELGADVIKVENSHSNGDVTRSWKGAGEKTDDRSAYFCSVNWGKKSIGIDLSKEDGKKILHELVVDSDIVLASFKPGDAIKLGADFETLRKIKTNIIYGQITGYGSDSERVGYDAVVQAETGFMDLNGDSDGGPIKMPVALIDVLAAHHLKEAILLALLHRQKTGEGKFVEVSLVHTGITSLSNQASNWLVANKIPKRLGSSHPNIAPYGDSFLTKDGKRILLAVGSDKQFRDLCVVLDQKKWMDDEKFSSNQKRVENRSALNELLVDVIAQMNSSELLPAMHRKKIPAGLIQNIKEVFEMPEAKDVLLEKGGIKGVRNFAAKGFESLHILPPPHYGEHSSLILIDKLSYSAEKVGLLIQSGTISGR